jgi:putative sterol carrier protein
MSPKIGVATQFATIRPLTTPRGRKLDDTIEQFAAALAGGSESGSVRLTIRGGEDPRQFAIDLGRKSASSKARRADKPDLEIVLQETTWWEIAEGRLSPADAFRRGKMRIRGDVRLAGRLYKFVAADDGVTDICLG